MRLGWAGGRVGEGVLSRQRTRGKEWAFSCGPLKIQQFSLVSLPMVLNIIWLACSRKKINMYFCLSITVLLYLYPPLSYPPLRL